jgi:hypothetical protein
MIIKFLGGGGRGRPVDGGVAAMVGDGGEGWPQRMRSSELCPPELRLPEGNLQRLSMGSGSTDGRRCIALQWRGGRWAVPFQGRETKQRRKVGGALPRKRDKVEEEGGRLSGMLNLEEGGQAAGFFG